MSRLNKVVSNIPVSLTEDEVNALSLTFSAVSAYGGGGQSGGYRYAGDDETIVLNTSQNTFSLHQNYIDAIAGIPTKVTDLTDSADYELASHASSTYLTKTSADTDYGSKTAVDALSAASAGWNGAATDVATLKANSANGTWLIASDIAGLQNKLKFGYDASNNITGIGLNTETNLSAIAQPSLSDYLKKSDAATAYQPSGYYATSSFVVGKAGQYALTSAGWEAVTGGGGGGTTGGITGVNTDDTLSGDGSDASHKLGVVWSTLSAETIDSAMSAGSASTAAYLGTSSLADISGAIGAKADATAISDMLTKTLAALTYQTQAGMSDYQTVAGMSDYQKTDDMSAYYLKTDTSSKSEISAALTGKQDTLNFGVYETGKSISSISGYEFVITALPHITVSPGPYISANENPAGTWTVGFTDVAQNAIEAVSRKLTAPNTADKNFIYTTSGSTSGWTDADAIYAKVADLNTKLNKADINITASDNVLRITTAANAYDTFSAVSFYTNTGDSTLKAQKMFVCTSDNDIILHSQYANGQGCLFFRLG